MNYYETIFGQKRPRRADSKTSGGERVGSIFRRAFASASAEVLDCDFHLNQAQELAKEGRYREADDYVSKSPDSCISTNYKISAFRGRVAEYLGNLQDAFGFYKKAIEVLPTDIEAYMFYHNIGMVLTNQFEYVEALKFFTAAIELQKEMRLHSESDDKWEMDGEVFLGMPTQRMYVNRANAYMNINNLDDAREDCIESAKIDFEYQNTYLVMYFVHKKMEQLDRAYTSLRLCHYLGNEKAGSILRSQDEDVSPWLANIAAPGALTAKGNLNLAIHLTSEEVSTYIDFIFE